MASRFVLTATADAPSDYRTLDERDEELLAGTLRGLAAYTTPVERAVLIHERDGGDVISAWDEAGALRLAQALPPAYAELAALLGSRFGKR